MLFSKTVGAQIGAIGETKLIEHIQDWLNGVTPAAPEGIGDDCAVITPTTQQQIITTDALTFGQHFDASVSAEQAGAKLINRNLSDIAAMGGTPDHAVLALLCGADTSIEWLEAFFSGIRNTCANYRLQIVGGDVSSLPKGHFSAVLTLVGSIQNTKLRSGASIGDHLYVTGTLGGSILNKHYDFTPRLAEGQWLAQQASCTALMDLTDGLAKDLQSLLPKQSTAALSLEAIPLSTDAQVVAKKSGEDPLKHAFCDGEDYELLFAIKQDTSMTAFEASWAHSFPELKLSRIGKIIDSSDTAGSYIDATTKEALPWTQGFEHLKG